MTARAHHRGHPMSFVDDAWRYDDTGGLVSDDPDRSCGHCNLPNSPDGHDPCIANLPGVMNACCGHGNDHEAYIQYPNGSGLWGVAARREQLRLGARR